MSSGWLLQRLRPGFFLVGDKPASECSPAVMNVHWHDSPADWLLQRQDIVSPVGAGLPANRAATQALPHAKIASRLAPPKSQGNIDSCQAWLLSLEVAVHLSRLLGFA